MKIYENRQTHKRVTHCPTCGNIGHMWMTCPAPAKMMELKKQGKEPDTTLYGKWQQGTYERRNEAGILVYHDRIFRTMQRQFDKQQERIVKRKRQKELQEQHFGKPAKRTSSCGFCGGHDHNRRNCDIMFNFQDDLARASTNYRKQFYERFVKGQGFAEGALVAVSAEHMYHNNGSVDNFEGVGIITKISWDKVNLGLTINNWEYRTQMRIEMLVNGQTMLTQSPFQGIVSADTSDDGKKGEIAELFSNNHGYGLQIDSVIAPSENLPSEEWFNEGYTDCWEWITKNKSLSDVSYRLAPLIAQWHPSRRGRNAGKLNYRLSQYGYTRRK